jgi:hypothetical protein
LKIRHPENFAKWQKSMEQGIKEKSEQNIWQNGKSCQKVDFNRKADKYIG